MPQRRKPSQHVNPVYEDSGLFKNQVGQIVVDLIPQMARNSRQDLVVTGFVLENKEICVVFAGRRASHVSPLVAVLKAKLSHARRIARGTGLPTPDITTIRYRVHIEGAWRPKFIRDDSGLETRSYHLMAARWSIITDHGQIDIYGAPPLYGRSTSGRLSRKRLQAAR